MNAEVLALKKIVSLIWTVCCVIALSGCSSLAIGDSSCDAVIKHYGSPEFDVEVAEYAPAQKSEKQIIVLPPTGGTNAIDRRYAKNLCSAGFQIHLVDSWTVEQNAGTGFGLHQKFYGAALKAVTLVLQKNKTAFNGILGTSVGALHASVAASSLSDIHAAFLIVGGAPIAEVIVTSDQQAMIDLKEVRRQKTSAKTDTEQINAISKAFTLEPLRPESKFFETQDIGMVIALEDTTVQTATQLQLAQAWKPKTVLKLSNGHFWAIVKTWMFHTDEIVGFFLKSAEARGTRFSE